MHYAELIVQMHVQLYYNFLFLFFVDNMINYFIQPLLINKVIISDYITFSQFSTEKLLLT